MRCIYAIDLYYLHKGCLGKNGTFPTNLEKNYFADQDKIGRSQKP